MERLLVFSPTKSFHRAIPKRHSALCRFRLSGDLTTEIRVCTNRSCRKQGSFQTLETLAGLAPPAIAVVSCGCLGRCGAGPNLVALPAAVIVSHCATAARSAEVMAALCGRSFDAKTSLEALALRKKAEKLSEDGDFAAAESLLSQAIELKPMGGIHILYKDRGVARLALTKYHEALGDATQALTMFPRFVEGNICQGDAFLALNQIDSAEQSYLTALDIDPSIRRSKSFKARIAMLQEKLSSAKT